MIAYIFRRLMYGVLILIGVNVFTFVLFFPSFPEIWKSKKYGSPITHAPILLLIFFHPILNPLYQSFLMF
jgi:hypothetical protein